MNLISTSWASLPASPAPMPDFNCNLIGIKLALGLKRVVFYEKSRDTPIFVTLSISIRGPALSITPLWEAAGAAVDRLIQNQLNWRSLIIKHHLNRYFVFANLRCFSQQSIIFSPPVYFLMSSR